MKLLCVVTLLVALVAVHTAPSLSRKLRELQQLESLLNRALEATYVERAHGKGKNGKGHGHGKGQNGKGSGSGFEASGSGFEESGSEKRTPWKRDGSAENVANRIDTVADYMRQVALLACMKEHGLTDRMDFTGATVTLEDIPKLLQDLAKKTADELSQFWYIVDDAPSLMNADPSPVIKKVMVFSYMIKHYTTEQDKQATITALEPFPKADEMPILPTVVASRIDTVADYMRQVALLACMKEHGLTDRMDFTGATVTLEDIPKLLQDLAKKTADDLSQFWYIVDDAPSLMNADPSPVIKKVMVFSYMIKHYTTEQDKQATITALEPFPKADEMPI